MVLLVFFLFKLNNDLCSTIIVGVFEKIASINNPLTSKGVDGITTLIPGKLANQE